MNWKITRPSSLKEFVGKETIKENLDIYIKSSLKNNISLDHCLFYGFPGTGKTSLAYIIANELKTNIKVMQGPSINKPIDIYNFALSLKEKDIIFIDEIHAMNSICFELLYSLMEDFVLDIPIGKDFNTKITRIKIPNFTLIAATTLLSKIPQPLEDRFGIIFNFKNYTEKEIEQILINYNKKIGWNINEEIISIIAKNAKGIPRNALRIFHRTNDFLVVDEKNKIKDILIKIGIIKDGIDHDDLFYLKILYDSNKALGIKTISQLSNWDQNYIESKIEPYLISNKYISKTNSGRVITNKGIDFINKL